MSFVLTSSMQMFSQNNYVWIPIRSINISGGGGGGWHSYMSVDIKYLSLHPLFADLTTNDPHFYSVHSMIPFSTFVSNFTHKLQTCERFACIKETKKTYQCDCTFWLQIAFTPITNKQTKQTYKQTRSKKSKR